jgi:hypothetical protein
MVFKNHFPTHPPIAHAISHNPLPPFRQNPPRNGEGDHPQDGGGAQAGSPNAESLSNSAGAPPPPPSAAVPLPQKGGITKDAIFAYCYAA